jgi:hypothetical protein
MCSDSMRGSSYLVKVDYRLPEVVALLVEIPHSNLSKVTRMVFIHVRSVMMLTTSQTSSTRMLAVLSYTTVTGGDMTAAIIQDLLAFSFQITNHTNSTSLKK